MFIQNMSMAAQQVAILYLIVAVGFIADRIGIFKQTTAKLSNDLLFYVITPVVIVQSFLNMEFNKETISSFLLAFVCMFTTLVVGIFIVIPFFRKDKDNSSIYKYAVSYGNMGYMALPLCQSLLGSEGVFYCSAGVVAFNILSFVHGIWLMKKGTENDEGFKIKTIVLNPGVLSVAVGLPLFISGLELPEIINGAVTHIANLNTPLAMIFLGTYIANSDLKAMFKQKQNYFVAFLKLLVLPAIMFAIFKLIGLSGTIITACMISASVPSATNTVMFAAKYGKDTGVASTVVAFCSLLSVLTIPVMIALSRV
ncbi:MAG: AEC family transporter [Ruminococcaceae bacterium]|nr:AEC family transporter [Oscillospiraceae bacterium]